MANDVSMSNVPKKTRVRLPSTMPIIERIYSKTDRSGGPDACWIWLAGTSRGYGCIGYNRTQVRVHRFVYEHTYGPIGSPKIYVCHRCDNRRCCNPKHLFLGTPAENQADMKVKDRCAFGPRNAMTIMTTKMARRAKRLLRDGVPVIRVARRVGVSRGAIRAIVEGRTHRRVTI